MKNVKVEYFDINGKAALIRAYSGVKMFPSKMQSIPLKIGQKLKTQEIMNSSNFQPWNMMVKECSNLLLLLLFYQEN